MKKVPKYENQQLQQRITANGANTTLSLTSSKLTDQDMKIVARELETNKVREHCFFLPLRLLQCHKSKTFLSATSMG
jgi:hypothetical protein